MPDSIDYNQLYADPQFKALTPHEQRVAISTVMDGDPGFKAIPSDQQPAIRNKLLGMFPDDAEPNALKLEPAQINQFLGRPYKFGGEQCTGQDCSSAMQELYGFNKVKGMPRTADAQLNWQHGQRIDDITAIQPGDHLFFQGSRLGPGKASHTGYFAGWDQTDAGPVPMMYAASSSKGGFVKQRVDKFLQTSGQTFLAAKRYAEFQGHDKAPQTGAPEALPPENGSNPLVDILAMSKVALGDVLGSDTPEQPSGNKFLGGMSENPGYYERWYAASKNGTSSKPMTPEQQKEYIRRRSGTNLAQSVAGQGDTPALGTTPRGKQGIVAAPQAPPPDRVATQFGAGGMASMPAVTTGGKPTPITQGHLEVGKKLIDGSMGPGTYEALMKDQSGRAEVAKFLTSLVEPENIALLGGAALTGGAHPLLAKAVAGYFGGQMVYSAGKNLAEGHPGAAAVDAALAALPLFHAVGKSGVRGEPTETGTPQGETIDTGNVAADRTVPDAGVPIPAEQSVPETPVKARAAKGTKPGASPQEAAAAPVADVSPAKPRTASPAAGEAAPPAPSKTPPVAEPTPSAAILEGTAKSGDTAEKPSGNSIETPAPIQPEETTGIAQRVHDRRAAEGKAGVVEPGTGMSPEEHIKRGRAALVRGDDPYKRLDQIEADPNHASSSNDFDLVRAEHERLGKITNRAEDAMNANPTDHEAKRAYEAAFKAENDFAKRIKPLQTDWSEKGRGQQGETGLDTGSFTSIRRAFNDANDRDMNAAEKAKAKVHAEEVKGWESKLKDIQSKLDEALSQEPPVKMGKKASSVKPKELPDDPAFLREKFAKMKQEGTFYKSSIKGREAGAVNFKTAPPNFDGPTIRAMWRRAKTAYIDKGMGFHDMVNNLAIDYGVKPEEIKWALSQNKAVRELSNEMYRTQYERRKAVNAAKRFVESANTPQWVKTYQTITNFPRAVMTTGHVVGMVTHAGRNIMRPSAWAAYWPNAIKQFKFFGSKAVHEAAMQTLERDDLYPLALRSGLKVDPGIMEDYAAYGKNMGRLSEAGSRAMDALKTFRMEYWKQELAKFPEEIQKDVAPLLANWVNHISGYGDIGHGQIASAVKEGMFASGLEGSRWATVLGDPIKTAKTFANWKNATPAEQAMAKFRVNRAAQLGAVYIGALMANKGIQMATGQKDTTNITDPTKSDFMRFKWNGRTLDPTGNMLAPFKFLSTLAAHAWEGTPKTGFNAGKSPQEILTGDISFYARGKLSPAYGIGVDAATRTDAINKPMPWNPQPTNSKGYPVGKPRFTYLEYLSQHGGLPIPFSGAVKEYEETMQENGVDQKTAHAVVNFFLVLGIEGVGVKVGKTPKEQTPMQKSTGGVGPRMPAIAGPRMPKM